MLHSLRPALVLLTLAISASLVPSEPAQAGCPIGGNRCCRGYQGYYWATPATGYFGTPYSYARPTPVFLPPYMAYSLYGIPGTYGNHCCPYNEDRGHGTPIRTHIRGTLIQ